MSVFFFKFASLTPFGWKFYPCLLVADRELCLYTKALGKTVMQITTRLGNANFRLKTKRTRGKEQVGRKFQWSLAHSAVLKENNSETNLCRFELGGQTVKYLLLQFLGSNFKLLKTIAKDRKWRPHGSQVEASWPSAFALDCVWPIGVASWKLVAQRNQWLILIISGLSLIHNVCHGRSYF